MIRENLEEGGDIHRSAAIGASWAHYAGIDDQGNPIDVVVRLKGPRMAAAALQHGNPLAFVSNPDISVDLNTNERFTAANTQALRNLHSGDYAQITAMLNR